ncbi:extracellular solute-binding protein [Bosea sp. (in: a-proteobacteria)]|uniref:ABC transporter substrate-binding protein n=1 Tax=Bosea sp. (in: a-proteobacteria) TaxID=1871050 RepID=UPI001D9D82A1|nr:extracellular solute-binding protein [Bosea sp. (in: a-proteobacteria)]MBA4223754.1 ABC transporter substrate-binding protein [Methylobacterium sp.]MBR3189714.1 extracellular solute-binding protein [Bosea sp. (in: a-proteobacteria)]
MNRRALCLWLVILIFGWQSAGQAQTRSVQIVTSFPPSFFEPFRTAFRARYPDILVEVVQRKTTAAVADIHAGKRHDTDLLWASAPDAFELLKQAGLLAQLQPRATGAPETMAGYSVNDPAGRYLGFAISGYGLVYNPHYLAARGLPVPRNWADLAAPAYAGHIGLTSPARSGTAHLMVEALLQSLGWERGWALWSAIGGNLATITARSFGVTTGVARGRFGIGISIDFLTEAGSAEGEANRFVLPEETLFAPANIARLATSPNPKEAELFIDFVLSSEGQKLLREPRIGRLAVSPAAYGPDETPPHLSETAGLFNKARFDAALSAGRYELVNIVFDEWITFRRAEHARLWRGLQVMEAALLSHPDEQAAHLLTQARASLTRPPIAAAELERPERFRKLVRVPRGLAVPEEQSRIETGIRSVIATNATEAAASLRQAAERLVAAGWAGTEGGLAEGRP